MDRRPAHRRPARQDAGRLELDQRPHLQSRPAARLRRLGAARQSRLGLCRRAALLPAQRAAHGRRCAVPTTTFRGKEGNLPITDLDWRDPICEAFIEGARGAGHPAQPRLQRHAAGGRQLRPAHHPERPPRQRRARLPEARHEARRTSPCAPTRMRPRSCSRASAPSASATTRAAGTARRREVRAAQGSDPVRRRGEQPAAAAGLGHRSGAAAGRARHRGEARAGRRRREPARPLRAALRGAGEERRDHQRAVARAASWSARC